jgi:RHS repeat-associated protein
MTDAAGSEAWSYQVDATNHRTVHVDQRTTNSSPSNITKNSTYYLDLSGNVTQAVYPTGRVVNYTYDSADRPSTAIDGSNGITYATDFQTAPTGCLANAVCYTPQGSFYALSIGQTGSFSGLNLTHTYNSRLQPNEFKASSAGGNAIDITYGFVDPVTSKNASHVYSITNNLDSTRSQTFTYDQLNRVATALTTSTYATSPSHCWGETYSLDAWGNLQSIAATTNPNYTGCTQESGFTASADGNNHLSGFSYDASGNTLGDGTNTYTWDGESQLKSSAGVNYLYDGDGRRVYKSNGKLYWYGSGGDILAETDASGNTLNEYIFFGGKRVAMLPASSTPIYYVEDLLGTSRIITSNTGVVCYDADFYPFGGERSYTNTCPQNYKFEGKERDSETGNDDFGARYYSNRFGRWLSADWSAVPVPVPYANLTNPQTLNLYSMVADDPESFADLDGHSSTQTYQVANPGGGFWDPTFATSDTGLFTGDNTPQENPSPRLGIGIEVPASSAVNNNVLNVANDPGHAFVYLKDSTGKVVSMLSFGPGQWILDNKDLFQTGGLAGNAHWSLTGSANTWESNITSAQLTTGIKAIADFKSNVPNFTPSFQCAAAALSIVQKVGLTLPNGVGPVVANKFGKTYFSGNVANPYHLNQQMTKQFGPPQVVKTSTFPAP